MATPTAIGPINTPELEVTSKVNTTGQTFSVKTDPGAGIYTTSDGRELILDAAPQDGIHFMTDSGGYVSFDNGAGQQMAIIDNGGHASFPSVTLGADPTQDLEAATKRYVDNHAGNGGGSGLANVGVPGAAGDGVTNDAAAFQAVTFSELWLPADKQYFIGTSITLPYEIRFISSAQMIIGNGVTVTLNGKVYGPLVQCFVLQGTGAVLLNRNMLIPVEWFGAVGDLVGTTGTDNTVALQNALNACQRGQILLQGRNYLTSATLTINRSFVGMTSGEGAIGVIYINSASATILSCVGTSANPLAYNWFSRVVFGRTVAPSANSIGLLLQYAWSMICETVSSSDSFYCFYLTNCAANGVGRIDNCVCTTGYSQPAAPAGSAGFYIGGGSMPQSTRIRNGLALGSFSYGLLLTGPHVEDVMVYGLETAQCDIGIGITYTGSGEMLYANDIHFYGSILDRCQTAGVQINNVPDAAAATIEISGGYIDPDTNNAVGIDVVNSTGVVISNVQMGTIRSTVAGIRLNGSTKCSVMGCNIRNMGTAAIQLTNSRICTVMGNTLANSPSYPTTTMINVVGSSGNNLHGNAIGGTATNGIVFDANSNYNSVIGANAIDPSNIPTIVADNGSNNTYFPALSEAQPPPPLQWDASKSTFVSMTTPTETTAAVDSTAINFIVAAVACSEGDEGSITDSYSNTWKSAISQINSSGPRVDIWYCVNPVVGPGHTFTSVGYSLNTVGIWLGQSSRAVAKDQTAGQNINSANSFSLSLTPTAINSLVCFICSFDQGAISSLTGIGGYINQATVGGVSFGVYIGLTLASSTVTVNGQGWTCNYALAMASFN